MPRYPDDDRLSAEIQEVLERHVDGVIRSATASDEVEDFSLPVISAFVCGFEITDAMHEEGRWYVHRTSTKRVSPIHVNGILNEMLHNWNID
jgi:hypothetical protein